MLEDLNERAVEEEEEEEEDSDREAAPGLGPRRAVALPANAEYSQVKDQLTHLPPLMQYETLQELKENNKATNRSVFAAVKDNPEDYSALQIRNYLKVCLCSCVCSSVCSCVCSCVCFCVSPCASACLLAGCWDVPVGR